VEVRRRPTGARPSAPAAEAVADAHPSTNGTSLPHPEASIVRAEIVGIVRLSRPSVSEGAEVDAQRELAYVESLGIRNPVRAAVSGRVASIFIEDGESVEYGQALFAIEAATHDS
jgi:acetyl-CoA carboxylase biotin carboxyl carrier protein